MAPTSAVTMSLTLRVAPSSEALFNPLPLKSRANIPAVSRTNGKRLVVVKASSMKNKVVTGVTAAALSTSMLIPQVAEAAELTPSLKNFLLSIAAGGVVLSVIIGAVVGVSNFDPVRRG